MKIMKNAIIKELNSNREIGFIKEITIPDARKSVSWIELHGHYKIEEL